MFEKFTDSGVKSVMLAQDEAIDMGDESIGTEHLFLGLFAEGFDTAFKVLDELGFTLEDTRKQVTEMTRKRVRRYSPLSIENPFTPAARRVLEGSLTQAHNFGKSYVGTEHILLALLSEVDSIPFQILELGRVDFTDLKRSILIEIGTKNAEMDDFLNKIIKPVRLKQNSGLKGKLVLDDYSTNLSTMARENKLDPVVGRKAEVQRLIQVLVRRRKNNAILLGDPGVGKTAVAEALALLIAEGTVPEILLNKELMVLEITKLLAGTKYRGEFEERLQNVISEVIDSGDIILVIDEIHMLVGAGGPEGGMDAANIIKPALARAKFQCIGATTNEEYRKHISKDPALERRFQTINVPEPSVVETILILNGLRLRYEQHHMLKIDDKALMGAAELSSQYVADRYLPDKAIDLIDEASARVRLFGDKMPEPLKSSSDELKIAVMEKDRCVRSELYEEAEIHHQRELELRDTLSTLNEENPDYKAQNLNLFNRLVSYDDIADLVSVWTGIPVNKVSKAENSSLMNVETLLRTRVIGQHVAVTSIAKAIKRSRMGFKNPNRPIGSFIFAGPTGVGKTELAKALASFFFGSESAMVRLDMSEYMERFNVSKLIGAPPGYVGFSDGGLLTEQVRRKPYSLVLFDEMEKAHGDVFNLLLQILEDGRLTDSQNRVIDFKNTLIILTSNVGAAAIEKIQNEPQKPSNILAAFMADEEVEVTDQYKKMSSAVQVELKKSFKPEFLNRLDEVIIFQQLTKRDVREIAEIMFKQLVDRVQKQSQVTLTIPKEIIDKFAEDGFDPAYGARPLRRLITNVFEDRLINAFLSHNYIPGTILSVRLNAKKEVDFYMVGFTSVVNKDSLEALIADSIRNDVVIYGKEGDPVKALLEKYTSKTKKTAKQKFKIRQDELRDFAIQNRINYFNNMYQMAIKKAKGKPHITIDQFLARAGESFDNIVPYIDLRLKNAPTEIFDLYEIKTDPIAVKMLNKCLEVEKFQNQENYDYNQIDIVAESDINENNDDIEKNS